MKKSEYPVRVLHVLNGLNCGGAETFIMNIYRNIDRNKIQFDFLLRSKEDFYGKEVEKMGGRIYFTSSFPRHFLKNKRETKEFFKKHKYDIIHVHANALLYMYALKEAKRKGTACRIIHSHNSSMSHLIFKPIHRWNKRRIRHWATHYFSCSTDAGKWMFPCDFIVLKNAVNTSAFQFDESKRKKIREELCISNETLVMGHTGRFNKQKNHTFLIDVLSEIVKKKSNVKLILVGDGMLREEIEGKVKALGLVDKVLFLGVRNDIEDILNAFDIFVFPSLYEGAPFSIIEAQANGLPIVYSEATPKDAIFSKHAILMNYEQSAKDWADCILESDYSRSDETLKIVEAGFDIETEVSKLEKFYLEQACR